MEQKIVLDDNSFKALSTESRIKILKELTNRRMTLSELSKQLALKNSTVKEHCNLLIEADLIKKIDEGRKWKYYELTNKGKKIVSPKPFEEIKILIILNIGIIIFSIIIFSILQGTLLIPQEEILEQKIFENQIGILEMDVPQKTIDQTTTIKGINYNFYATSIIFSLILGTLIGWFVKKRT